MIRRFVQTLAVLALTTAPVLAQQPMTWQVDTPHTAAQFSVRHMMVSNVRGEFTKTTGTVQWDGKDFSTAVVDVTIDAASISTREPRRDAHLKSADFFDVEKYPTLTFKSTKIEPAGPGKLRMAGNLTIRGVTKPVVFAVEGPTPPVKDPMGVQRVGASASTTINRKDFGVSFNAALETGGVVVGDEVAITVDIELVAKPAAPAPGAVKK
ncbi:MAG TPA: YceI family protein [Vicinamibacterales bacterium]